MMTKILDTDHGTCWVSESGKVYTVAVVAHYAAFAHDLARELVRIRGLLEQQRAVNLELAERLRACAEVLGKAAERGKVCQCQNGGDHGPQA